MVLHALRARVGREPVAGEEGHRGSGVLAGDGIDEGTRIFLAPVREHVVYAARLDDATVLEHRDGVGDLADECETKR
jgi:hypothetical protein